MNKKWFMAGTLTLAEIAAAQAPLSFSRSEVAGGRFPANAFAIADFNRDRKPDVAFVTGGGTYVMLGRGDGSFEAAKLVDASASYGIAAVDLNNDGSSDLVTSGGSASDSVAVVLGHGDGSFGPPQRFPAGATPMGLVVADFNGDGRPDVAVTNIAGLVPGIAGKTVTVLLGKGDGTFGAPLSSPVIGERPFRLAAGDLNQDGKPDLVVVNSSTQDVSLLLGNGDGTFSPRSLTGPGAPLPLNFYTDVKVSDFNLDGRADIAVQTANGAVLILLRGAGETFQPVLRFVFDGQLLAVGDVNGDGVPDLAAVSPLPSAALLVLLGNGDGSFASELAFDVGSVPTDLALGDFNADGQMDVVVGRTSDSSVSIFLNTTPQPAIFANRVVNAASFQTNGLTVAPGEVVTIFGKNLGPLQLVTARLKTPELLDTNLAGTRVLFDGIAAPLVYTRSDQVTAIVPYGAGNNATTRLQIAYGQTRSAPFTLRVAPSVPAIFTANSSGSGQGAVINQDGSLNSAQNPAGKRSIVTFFVTGEGQTNPPGVDGKLAADPLPVPVLPVIVGIANIGAEILYAGAAPGVVAGVLQINAVVPPDAPSGSRVPLVVKIGDAFSPDGVFLAIE